MNNTEFHSKFSQLNVENRKIIVQLINNLFILQQSRFQVCSNRKQVSIPTYEIMYIEKVERHLCVKTTNEEFLISGSSITQTVKELPLYFVLVNQSVCVNMIFIAKIEKDLIVMKGGKEFYLARNMKKKFYSAYSAITQKVKKSN